MLSPAELLIVTTHRTDRYGRYLADSRYLPGCDKPRTIREEGRCLNLELLERGMALRYV